MIPSQIRRNIALIIFSENFTTRFMQAADMFEDFKVLIKPPLEATVVDDFGQNNVDAMLKQLEGSPYSLVAVVTKDFRWLNPQVKTVSTGTHWCTLENYLASMGYKEPLYV